MRAVRLIEAGRPLAACGIDPPGIGPQDVLVRVKAAGICHSDAHYRAGRLPAGPLPVTPGHEVAGTVEQVGTDVAAIEPGDRVCLHYMVTCGECVCCVEGREQFCTSGTILMCSAATSPHALRQGRMRAGETVAVWGTGGLGVSAVQLARILGAARVYAVDLEESKLEVARRLRPHGVGDPSAHRVGRRG